MLVYLSRQSNVVLRPLSNSGGHLGAFLHLKLRRVSPLAVALQVQDGPHIVGTPRFQIPVCAGLAVGYQFEQRFLEPQMGPYIWMAHGKRE